MSALLLPELARETAGSNRRVAEKLEAESRRLEQLREKAEDGQALKKQATRSARGATGTTMSRKADVLGLWQHALEVFADGLEGGQARDLLQTLRESIDSWLRLAEDCRAMWRFAATLGSPPQGPEGLDAAEEEVKRVKAAVEKMQAFLSRPRPPVDVGRFEKGREDLAQGRYRTGAQIRSGNPPAEGGKE
jgi:hypothetical protein